MSIVNTRSILKGLNDALEGKTNGELKKIYIHELYKLEHPNVKPTSEHLPLEIQINQDI